MKTIRLISAMSALGSGSYESPEVKVAEVVNEGVLCMSGNIELWDEETLTW